MLTLPHSSHSSTPPLTVLHTIPKTHSLPPIHITSSSSFTAVLYADGTAKVFDHRTSQLLCTHMHSLPGATSSLLHESSTDVLLLLTSPNGISVYSLNAAAVVAVLIDAVTDAGVVVCDDHIVAGGDSLLFVFPLPSRSSSSSSRFKNAPPKNSSSSSPSSKKKRKQQQQKQQPPSAPIPRSSPIATIPVKGTVSSFTASGSRLFLCLTTGSLVTFLLLPSTPSKPPAITPPVPVALPCGKDLIYVATHVNARAGKITLSLSGETLLSFTPPLSLPPTSSAYPVGPVTELTLSLPPVISLAPLGETAVAIVTERGGLLTYDVDNQATRPFTATGVPTCTVLCCAASPNGDRVVAGTKDARVIVFGRDGEELAVMKGHMETVTSVACSAKAGKWAAGKEWIVSASKDKTVKLWTGGKCVASIRGGEKDINELAVSPNDALVATAGADKTCRLYAAKDLGAVAVLKGHRRGVFSAAFSAVDKVIATGAGDETVRVWSLSDYTCVRTLQGHAGAVLRVCFAGGGSQIVTGGSDGMVKVWTVKTMESCTADGHDDKVWGLAVLPDGRVVSGGGDRVNVWRDNSEELRLEVEKAKEENVLGEQELSNAIRKEDWGAALEKSMGMDKPETTLKVLNDMRIAGQTVDLHVKGWGAERVGQIMRYCRSWNTRSLNCHTAAWVAAAVIKNRGVDELAAMPEVVEYAGAMRAYSERHFERMEGVIESSYEVDFVTELMGGMEEEVGEEEEKGREGAWDGMNVAMSLDKGDVGGIEIKEKKRIEEERKLEAAAAAKVLKSAGAGGAGGNLVSGGEDGGEDGIEIIGYSSEEEDELMDEDRD